MYYIRIDLSKKELKRAQKLAIIASMRKILLIAHAMYRDKTEYITV